MNTLQDLFGVLNKESVTSEDFDFIRLHQLPNNLWALGISRNGEEFGGTATACDKCTDKLREVALQGAEFTCTIKNGDHVTINC